MHCSPSVWSSVCYMNIVLIKTTGSGLERRLRAVEGLPRHARTNTHLHTYIISNLLPHSSPPRVETAMLLLCVCTCACMCVCGVFEVAVLHCTHMFTPTISLCVIYECPYCLLLTSHIYCFYYCVSCMLYCDIRTVLTLLHMYHASLVA